MFAATSFTPASAVYRAHDSTRPSANAHPPSSLLPEPPKLSFTIPEPASQAKQVTIDPTPRESPIRSTTSAPLGPWQSGEPFFPDLDVSAYSTDYAQLRDKYEAEQQELRTVQGHLTFLQHDLDIVQDERDNPYCRYNARVLRSNGLKPSS